VRGKDRSVVYVRPEGLSRQDRRALQKALGEPVGQRPVKEDTRGLLPDPAVPGPLGPGITNGGYWNPVPMDIPFHESTSHQIAGMYPFVADAGFSHRGPVLGVDMNADSLFQFSPWEAYADSSERGAFSTNVLVLGMYRGGKSGTIKLLSLRSLEFGYRSVVPSDSKGEWVAAAEAVGGVVIRLGAGSKDRINPLDRGPRRTGSTNDEDEGMVRQRRITTLIAVVEMAGNTQLKPDEHAALQIALERAIAASDDHPTLRGVFAELGRLRDGGESTTADMREAARGPWFILRRFVDGDLSDLFEDEATVVFDQEAPMVVVDTSELFNRSELVAQITQVCTTAWTQAVISDRKARQNRYLIREEGWRDMTSVAALRMYQQWLKLSRHYGVSNIVLLHKMADLDAVGAADSLERNLAYSMVGDIENKFIFRTNSQEHASLKQRLNLPQAHADLALTLRKGEFIAYVGSYSYVVDAFATSTPWEYELTKTDDAMTPEEYEAAPALPGIEDMDRLWPVGGQDLGGWDSAMEGIRS